MENFIICAVLGKKNPIVFHDLQNYDSHLIFQEVRKYDFK